jgi:hypothetical protein
MDTIATWDKYRMRKRESYRKLTEMLHLCIKYLDYFRTSGPETMDAFLAMIGSENIYVTDLNTRIKEYHHHLSATLDSLTLSRWDLGLDAEMEGMVIEAAQALRKFTPSNLPVASDTLPPVIVNGGVRQYSRRLLSAWTRELSTSMLQTQQRMNG